VTALTLMILGSGCASLIDPNGLEPIRANRDPEFGREYLLYRPSSYDREQAWPLVVVCPSSFPDSPNKRLRAWTQQAEQAGFLVVAPHLKGNRKDFPARAEKQVPLLRQDEQHILSAIRHVCAGHTISENRIFILGFSGGGHPALYTGLRHPEIFRAVSLAQPRFDQSYLANCVELIDPHQPVFVERNITDTVTGKHARRCIEWLQTRLENVKEDTTGGLEEASTQRHVEFLEDVLRTIPWIRIRALPGPDNNALAVQFKLHHSGKPQRYNWTFGDGGESTVAEPLHVYGEPGTFRVAVTVEDAQGKKSRRAIDLSVPQLAVRHANAAAPP